MEFLRFKVLAMEFFGFWLSGVGILVFGALGSGCLRAIRGKGRVIRSEVDLCSHGL